VERSKNMKIIFLDIDGVVINRAACMKGFKKVDEDCVKRLNRITDETGALIVLSSCWRLGRTIPEIREMLKLWGITGKVLDRTRNLNAERGLEIDDWLDSCPREVEKFVILDDDTDMAHLRPHLVKTNFVNGLTEREAKEVLKKLK
jgi:hypothetical protein